MYKNTFPGLGQWHRAYSPKFHSPPSPGETYALHERAQHHAGGRGENLMSIKKELEGDTVRLTIYVTRDGGVVDHVCTELAK